MPALEDLELEAVSNSLRQIAVSPEFFNRLPKRLRGLAFTVNNLSKVQTIRTVLSTLNTAVEEGQTFQQWRDGLDVEALDRLNRSRLQTVYRTNVQKAFNNGVFEFAKANKDEKPFLMYDAVNDSRTRPNHRALDETIKPVDDPFWKRHTPPLGFNCRCQLIPLDLETAQGISGKRRPSTSNTEIRRKERRAAREFDVDEVSAGPDKGFKTNNLSITEATDRELDKAINQLPRNMRKQFRDEIKRRQSVTDRWFERNKQEILPDE